MFRSLVQGVPRMLRFTRRVGAAFLHNKGLLLAGGVGYNTLLSAVPFFAVTVTGLSYFFAEATILRVAAAEVEAILPNYSHEVMRAVRAFLASREVVGVIGTAGLIFFSSLAFRMLEEAISVIFGSLAYAPPRRFWISAVLPYVALVLLTLALFALALLHTAAEALGGPGLVEQLSDVFFQVLGFVSQVILFMVTYQVLPVVRVAWRRAFFGGLAAALLWELVGRLLAYYFTNVSLVGVVYGSLATVVVVLLTLEAGAIILLLGAQVIAELEASAHAGLPWYEDPRSKGGEATAEGGAGPESETRGAPPG